VKGSTTEREFRAWAEYYARQPSVVDVLDWWFAQLLAVTINANRVRGRRVSAKELIPDRWADRKEASPEAFAAGLKAWFAALSARQGARP